MSNSENKVAYILQIWFLINELNCCFLHILIFNKGDLCYPTRKLKSRSTCINTDFYIMKKLPIKESTAVINVLTSNQSPMGTEL